MASVNKVILVGNLGRDPETRYTTGGEAVTNVSIATTDTWKDKAGEKQERTEWHRVAFFGKLAEIAGEYLKKGSQVYVEGRLQTRKWQDKEGQEKYTTEIIADRMQMLGSRAAAAAAAAASRRPSASAARAPANRRPQRRRKRTSTTWTTIFRSSALAASDARPIASTWPGLAGSNARVQRPRCRRYPRVSRRGYRIPDGRLGCLRGIRRIRRRWRRRGLRRGDDHRAAAMVPAQAPPAASRRPRAAATARRPAVVLDLGHRRRGGDGRLAQRGRSALIGRRLPVSRRALRRGA